MADISLPSWPSGVISVFRHEWRQLINSPLTYIFLIGFTLALVASIFLVAEFLTTDEASIRLMIVFLPWVALVFVPALAMRSWTDSATDRSLELTLSLPVGPGALVAGKFLAGSAVLVAGLACTISFPLTVAYLGEPDRGTLIAGYAGAVLYLLTAYALCLLAASLMRDQVSAFILGVAALLVLTLAGWDVFGSSSEAWMPAAVRSALLTISPKYWLDRVSAGNLEWAAIAYILASIGFFLGATVLILNQRARAMSWGQRGAWLFGGAIGLAALLVVSAQLAGRLDGAVDLTDEQEFTLPAAFDQLLDELPVNTDVTVYWSSGEQSVPVSIKSHARRIISKMRVIAKRARGRIKLTIADPRPDSDAEFAALQSGIRRIPMTSGDFFYLGVTAKVGERAGHVAYLDPRREQLLDYDIAVLLAELVRKSTRRLGILSPLISPSQLTTGRQGLSVLSELRQSFDVAIVPHFSAKLPPDLDALLVLDATILKPEMLYDIDQFVLRGGGLVVLLDPHLRSNPPSNSINPDPSEEINDLSDLLLRYGIRYLGKDVVGDQAFAAIVMNSQQQQSNYPFWLRLTEKGISKQHPVSASLHELLLAEPGALSAEPGARILPLLQTSSQSGALTRQHFRKENPGALASRFKQSTGLQSLAVLATGPHKSAFPAGGRSNHLEGSNGAVPVFVVADADWIFDDFAVQHLAADGQAVTRPLNDNHTFLLNMLEFASGDKALIELRSRGRTNRPFTRVEKLFKEGRERYRGKETELVKRVSSVEANIAQLPQAAGVKSLEELPDEIRQRVNEIRQGLIPLKRELRSIRFSMREDVDALQTKLTILNLLAGPLLVLLLALAARFLRFRWRVR